MNQDIVIKERNVTGINEGQGVLTIDGLSENVNVAPTGSVKNGYTEYTYTYPSEIFAKEGIYRINVVSTDKAGNSNEFIRENKWQLCVDRTAPTITCLLYTSLSQKIKKYYSQRSQMEWAGYRVAKERQV